MSFPVELINHIYVFLEVKFSCRVYIGEASVNTLQIILNFHEIFISQVHTIHDIVHVVIMSKFLLYEGFLLDVSLRL